VDIPANTACAFYNGIRVKPGDKTATMTMAAMNHKFLNKAEFWKMYLFLKIHT
jgi:hypothetical protein